ncbi:phosphoethanolamine transferase [Celerinatantimonas sp. YJH-8]|uniref:phosphoethanolamine transferase n=1 Tax=Celerinatantimonas sp. YJH-8 TaxID=3228714 RepID=UPI0038C85834
MKLLARFRLSNANMTLVLATFFSLILNVPVYSDLHKILSSLDNFSIGFAISVPIFFILALNILFNVLSWPYLIKPFFILILIVSSLLSYAEFNYGIIFDKSMIRNLFETNSSEASSYFSAYSFIWFLLLGILPAYLLAVWPIKRESIIIFCLKKIIYVAASVVGILVIAFFFYQDYASVVRNNRFIADRIVPTAFIHNSYRYLRKEYFSAPIPYQFLGEDAHQSTAALQLAQQKPTVLIFMVGETARAQNFSFNGYARNTTPYSQGQSTYNFKNVASCGTATAISVPCMFSHMNRTKFDRDLADHQDNAIDIMKRAGIDLLWKENDGGDKHVAQGIQKVELTVDKSNPLCNGRTCYDMALLTDLDQEINAMKGNRAIFLHLIGSHGPTYFQRYPKSMAHFQPDCQRADIENCSVQEIVNTYDNTLRYTDYVFNQVIEKLKSLQDHYNVGVIYISDHGESLGEDGLFLHGAPYRFAPKYQTHVPLMMWFSDGLIQAKQLNRSCLKSVADEGGQSQDNIFDSLLGIMDVQTSVYRPAQDIFSRCRKN